MDKQKCGKLRPVPNKDNAHISQLPVLYLFIHDLINKYAVTHLQDSLYLLLCLTDVSSVSAETEKYQRSLTGQKQHLFTFP